MGCFTRRGYSTIENRNISSLTKNLVKTHHLHKAIKIDVLFTAHTRQTAKRRRGLEKQGLTLSCFEREEATNNITHHWYFLPSRHAWNRQATLTHTARRCSRLVLQSRRGFFIFVIVVGIIMCLTWPLIFSQRGVYPLSSGFATFFNLSGHLDGIFCRKYHLSCFYGINCLCESGFYHAETVWW